MPIERVGHWLASGLIVSHLAFRVRNYRNRLNREARTLLRPQTVRRKMGIPNFEGLVEAMDKLEFTLDSEAVKLHTQIQSVGVRGLDAIKKGSDKVAGVGARVARVEQFVNKLEGSNGAPLSGSSNTSDSQTIAAGEVGKVEDGVDAEHLTVNGVSTET